MKTIDQKQMEEIYEKVSLKGAIAGAALAGLGSMTGAHAGQSHQMTSDDYADKEMIEYAKQSETITPQEAFNKAIQLIHANSPIPKEYIIAISTNNELAKRCSYLMVMKGLKLPTAFKKIAPTLEKDIKSSVVGP